MVSVLNFDSLVRMLSKFDVASSRHQSLRHFLSETLLQYIVCWLFKKPFVRSLIFNVNFWNTFYNELLTFTNRILYCLKTVQLYFSGANQHMLVCISYVLVVILNTSSCWAAARFSVASFAPDYGESVFDCISSFVLRTDWAWCVTLPLRFSFRITLGSKCNIKGSTLKLIN